MSARHDRRSVVVLAHLSATALIVLALRETLLTRSTYFALVPILFCLGAVAYGMRRGGEVAIEPFGSLRGEGEKSCVVASVLFTLMFVFQLSPLEIVAPLLAGLAHSTIVLVWCCALLLPTIVVSSFYMVRYVLLWALARSCSERSTGTSLPTLSQAACTAVVAVVSVACVLSVYPGIHMQNDIINVWHEANLGQWSDWHCIGFLMFVRLCGKVVDSPFFVNCVQTVVWIAVNAYGIRVMSRMDGSGRMRTAYVVLGVCLFMPYLYLSNMVKDVMFSTCMLALSFAILGVVHGEDFSWLDLLVAVLGAAGASVFRHGGVFVVAFVGICLALYLWRKGRKMAWAKALVFAFAGVVAFAGVQWYGTYRLDMVPNPGYVKYGTPLAQLSNALSEGIELDQEDVKTLEKIMPLDDWRKADTTWITDPTSRVWGVVGNRINVVDEQNLGGDILRANVRLLVREPVFYIRSLLRLGNTLWEFGEPTGINGRWSIAYSDMQAEKKFMESLGEYPASCSGFYGFTHAVTEFVRDTPVLQDVCQRGGAVIFFMAVGAYLLRKRGRQALLFAFLPMTIYWLTLTLTIPATDTRYVLPMLEMAPVMLALLCDFAAAPNASKGDVDPS